MRYDVSSKAVAKGSKDGVFGALGTLYERRWLLWYFIQRQMTQNSRGAFLGFTWLILGPLLMVALYTLVFSEIIGLRFRQDGSVSNFGLYLYCGLIPFLAFSETVSKSVVSIKSNSSLVKKVLFPLEVLPFSVASTSFLAQFFGIAALMVLVIILEGTVQWTIVLLPIIAVPQLIFVVGVSCVVSVAGAYLPDLRESLRAFTRIMLFATPVIWPAERAYERGFGFIVDYNPLAFIVETYRNLVLDGEIPSMMSLMWFTLFSVALLAVGLAMFVRAKKRFADII